MPRKINPLKRKKQNQSDGRSHPIYIGLLGQAAIVTYDPLADRYHMNTKNSLVLFLFGSTSLNDIKMHSLVGRADKI